MKVIFKVIKAGSGNDIYFQRLSEALKTVNIDSVIEYYPKYFQYVPWLLKFFNKRTPGDIIHSNVEYGWVFKEKDKPLFVSLLHNVFEKEFQKSTSFQQKIYHYGILKPNTQKSLNIADKVIAISKYTKDSFKKSFKAKTIDVLYCCINTNIYKPLEINSSSKKFKLLFVGNLIKRKGADLLPQIMSQLGEDYVLYYTSGLRSKIPEEFNISNMIPLQKLTEKQLIEEYNKCDALLFPTRLEGFGYAVAEAMACGKPVISSKNSSIPELVKDNINGFLCDTNNISQYIDSIRKLNKNKKLVLEMNVVNRNKILTEFSYQSSEKILLKYFY
jgi:glycosyltransferase involved in cell wall biosynthesis